MPWADKVGTKRITENDEAARVIILALIANPGAIVD
jgi:hypothetical protein